jgi:hypothetical protein
MALAAATDLADIASAVIEARARQRIGADLRGGIAWRPGGDPVGQMKPTRVTRLPGCLGCS